MFPLVVLYLRPSGLNNKNKISGEVRVLGKEWGLPLLKIWREISRILPSHKEGNVPSKDTIPTLCFG